MSRKDAILNMHQILIKRRDALRKALAGDLSLLKELRAQSSGDVVDAALDSVQDEISSQLAEVESRELARIEYALERMREGQFGICEGCGASIPMARLNALPYATYCITCQREAERQGASFGRRCRLEPAAGFLRRRRRPVDQRHRAGRVVMVDPAQRGGYTWGMKISMPQAASRKSAETNWVIGDWSFVIGQWQICRLTNSAELLSASRSLPPPLSRSLAGSMSGRPRPTPSRPRLCRRLSNGRATPGPNSEPNCGANWNETPKSSKPSRTSSRSSPSSSGRPSSTSRPTSPPTPTPSTATASTGRNRLGRDHRMKRASTTC